VPATEEAKGLFPFGQPNRSRPPRLPDGDAAALVVGVYPSAFHIAWHPPTKLDPRPPDERRHPLIAALAVDVEPVVCWDGATPGPADLLDAWRTAIGFDPGAHGSVKIGRNGPSGAALATDVLRPLGLEPASAAFTDASRGTA
jgi:hypothetical protein